ncbi:MAG: peptidoglycan-binding protein, partial [Candidatus Pacebacteria bacterium]|nr:peptidoglycan-binding protein [Candidatus Paceibacterota bacterium]
MKNFIYLFITFLLIFFTKNAYACSPVAGFTYPSPDSVLSQDDTAIGMYKITSDGSSVPGTLIIGNKNSIMNMTFYLNGTSCGTRFNDFNIGEYVVSIFNKNDTKIHHIDLDAQFSYSFQLKSEAIKKFNILSELWNERSDSTIIVDGNIYYSTSSSTLKPGMSNKEVLSFQNALKIKLGLGNDFKLDGSYGPATIAAVKQFQLSEGLDSDGIAGTLTQKKLETVIVGQSEYNEEVIVSSYKPVGYTLKPGMK